MTSNSEDRPTAVSGARVSDDAGHLHPRAGRQARCQILLFGGALASLLACVGIFSVDQNLSTMLRNLEMPGDLRKAIDLSEAFAHGFGASVILGSILLVAARRRKAIWVAIGITLVSGLVGNGLKCCFVRIRPHAQHAIRVSEHGSAATGSVDQQASAVGAGADSGSPVEVVEKNFWDARQRSFPSGHAATAWGLAIGLSLVFPRGTWLFGILAIVACVQRVTSGAHYPSDVIAGAGVAFLCGAGALFVPGIRDTLTETEGNIEP